MEQDHFRITQEEDHMAADVEAITCACFGGVNPARAAHRLRGSSVPLADACFVAVSDTKEILGSLRAYPVAYEGSNGVEMLPLVGPLAVLPELRGQGVGHGLITRLLASLDRSFVCSVIIGDPGYYAPFGFRRVVGLAVEGEVSPLVLMERLPEGKALIGRLRYCGESAEAVVRA